jgi:lysophospholipase L1-like esterase
MRFPFSLLAVVAAFVVSAEFAIPRAHSAPPPVAEVVVSLAVPVAQRDASGTATLTCTTPGAVIRYSLDGTDPGPKTGPYLAPIVLPAGGVVKARAFSEDRKQMSELAETKFEPLPDAVPLPTTLVPCTQDRDWPAYDWAARHAAVTKLATDHKAALVFLGDSITQMFGGEPHDRPQAGKEVWEQHFGQRNAVNLGYGYDFVENALWRLTHGEIDGAAAKVVVIAIGTNNISRNAPEEIAVGIREVCALVHQRQPQAKIILMAIFPRGAKPDATRAKVDAVNKLIASLDGKNNVTFLDIGAKFLEPDGTITRETMGDFLHPTAKGYETWASELEPLLAKFLGEAKP